MMAYQIGEEATLRNYYLSRRNRTSLKHNEQACHPSHENPDFTQQQQKSRSRMTPPSASISINDEIMLSTLSEEDDGLTRSTSDPMPIPNSVPYDNGLDEIVETIKYDKATWNMYHRIRLHRRKSSHSNGRNVTQIQAIPCLPALDTWPTSSASQTNRPSSPTQIWMFPMD